MRWFRNLFAPGPKHSEDLSLLQKRFTSFLSLLERNNRFLKLLGDMEEKSQGEHLFDMSYIRSCVAEARSSVSGLIECMIALGGDSYGRLRDKYLEIDALLEETLSGRHPVRPDPYTIPFECLDRERAWSVGSKNAQLGELRSKLGLPVPDGFAVTAWAYKRFIDANDLQARITERIAPVDIRRQEDLVRVSGDIQALVCSSPVPEDLAGELRAACSDLAARTGSERFSLRSSAIGEDTLFSFAGQYATFLDVHSKDVVDRYRAVLAGKFTPQAIYYFLSHDLSESELAMSAGCVAMIDATAAGVVYTRDPLHAEDDLVLVSSIFGLGKYLVDGTLTPDLFRVSRDGSVFDMQTSEKPVRLVLKPDGGTAEEAVPERERSAPSIGGGHLKRLAEFAARIEDHYGCPQDIEWALDRRGRIYLLQTRPLRVVKGRSAPAPVPPGARRLAAGGTTVCPGAGAGAVYHAASTSDLGEVPEGAVLVAPHPFPGLITAMGKISALVTEAGGVASHMATLAREYRIPTLAGLSGAGTLPQGAPVTVDATDAVVFAGFHPDLIDARHPDYEYFEDMEIFALLERVLGCVSPLGLLNPSDPDFRPESCRTFHDLTRYAHQRAMEEMFLKAKGLEHKERFGIELKSRIPLRVNIIYIDQELAAYEGRRWISEDDLASVPMASFWRGIQQEGWPSNIPHASVGGLMSVLTTHLSGGDQLEFSENSFAILGREYMILSLQLGYHFTTIEALCTSEPSKNYIRIQQKGGGASTDRRIRRIALIQELLSRLGFEHSGRGDFLDSCVSYLDSRAAREALQALGRITMLTRQLDMALSNDVITRWYTEDFAAKLGLAGGKASAP